MALPHPPVPAPTSDYILPVPDPEVVGVPTYLFAAHLRHVHLSRCYFWFVDIARVCSKGIAAMTTMIRRIEPAKIFDHLELIVLEILSVQCLRSTIVFIASLGTYQVCLWQIAAFAVLRHFGRYRMHSGHVRQ
jgi:hypothetical protein